MKAVFAYVIVLTGIVAGCQLPDPAAFARPPVHPDAGGVSQGFAEHQARTLPPVTVQQVAFEQELMPPAETAAEEVPSPTALTNGMAAEFEERALAGHPAVARATARVLALRGKWYQVGLPPNPHVGYAGEDFGDEGSAGMHGMFVEQRFVTGSKLPLRRAVVAEEIQEAEHALSAIRYRVRTDVRTAYYDVLAAQRNVELARELLEISEQAVEASRNLFDAGEIARVAVLQAELESQRAMIRLQEAEMRNRAARRNLLVVIGDPEIVLPPQLTGDLERAALDLDWHFQLDRLLSSSPEIHQAVARLQHAERELVYAYAEVTPDIDVELSVQYDDAAHNTVAGVQVGLPLPLWDKNQGRVQEAYRQVQAASADIRRLELHLEQRLSIAFQRYADARYQARQYAVEILPKASETLELIRTGFASGQVGSLDMLNAQRTYFETNLAYLEALRALWNSTLHIEGLLLEGSLRREGAEVGL